MNEALDEGLELHPLAEQRESVRDWRQIGLGVMGIADMLIKLKITYGSQEALNLCDEIGLLMANTAIRASARLAKEKGKFPKCIEKDIINTEYFIKNTDKKTRELVIEYGLRNSQILTIAPTGSTSTLLEVSGGIEPIFANFYTRKTESLHGEETYYKVYTKIAKEYLKNNNTETLPIFFVESKDLNYKNRIDMQSIWQSHIDASISSTVNLPEHTTIEDIEKLYLYAWEKGLKGITVYRSGCKREGILTTEKETKKTEEPTQTILKRGDWKPKAEDTIYYQRKLSIGCGKLNLFIGWSNKEKSIQDFFVKRVGQGGCERLLESTVISMSAIYRLGGNIENIEKAFTGIGGCNSFASQRNKGKVLSKGSSCGNVIMNELSSFTKEMLGKEIENPVIITSKEINKQETIKEEILGATCPECKENTLYFEGGCVTCKSCGKELPQ